MKTTVAFVITLLLFCCWALPTVAQSSTFRNLTISDGLSGLQVNAIYKDTDGFVWLGTDNCLDRFDGIKVRHFPFRSADVRRKRVTSIAETTNKQIWTGNALGLFRLNPTTNELEHIAAETIDTPVNALVSDGETLYIGTDRGLFIQQNGRLKQVLADKNLFAACNRITCINLDTEKKLIWLGTVQGLYNYSLSDGVISAWHYETNVPEADYFRCVTRMDHLLYLGTMNQGVVCFNTLTHTFSHPVNMECDVVPTISSDGKDLIYIGTDGGGVHFFSHKQQRIVRSFRRNIHDKESIRSNSVYSLMVDDKEMIWIGYYQNGLDYTLYQNGLFTTYTYPPLFDSGGFSVRTFLIHGTQKLIGTRDGLFYINEATGVVKSFSTPWLRSNLILTVCYYAGEFYIGTYGGGLSVLNPHTLTLHSFNPADTELFSKGHVFKLCTDKQYNLWISTAVGVYRYNAQNKQLKLFDSTNCQLPEGNVYEVFFDTTGKGWLATETGLAVYDPASQSIRSNIFPDGFIHKEKIRTIREDAKNNILFLPEKGNVLISTPSLNQFYRLPVIPAVAESSFMSVVEDNLGGVWLACNDGIVRTKERGGEYDAFTFNDGVPSSTFTNGAAYKDAKGVLWFGNTKGLIYVDPQEVDIFSQGISPIYFTDLVANGVSVNETLLSCTQNNVTFSFTNLSYGLPSAMMYEYRLEGVDEEWKLLRGQSEVSYYDLASGSYVFHVRLPGNDVSESSIAIQIRPLLPVWLWILIVIVVLILLVAMVRFIKHFSLLAISSQPSNSSVETNAQSILQPAATTIKPSEEKYKTHRLTPQECTILYAKLKQYMDTEKPYTNSELKIGDLASAIDASSHSLSYIFNQYLNQSYYDFINEYRVLEFKRLITDTRYSRYTLSALAECCGFSSRASFFRSFKKSTGITPNEYIRNIGRTDKVEE